MSVAAAHTERVFVAGDPGGLTNSTLAAGWRGVGVNAIAVTAGDARRRCVSGDVVVGRVDVLPTLDGVGPGLLDLLLLERGGARVLNGAESLLVAHDKLRTARALDRAGLPHPRTVHLRPGEAAALAPPLVLKPRFGSWGFDVFRCESQRDLRRCLDEIVDRPWFLRHGAILQELVPFVGHDLRLLVACGRVVGAIERRPAAGEWRTNAALGGSVRAAAAPPDARALALAAARAVGADLVGVDLLPRLGGDTILEVNGAVDFDQQYAFAGRSIWADAAVALGLLGSPTQRSPRSLPPRLVAAPPARPAPSGAPARVQRKVHGNRLDGS